MSIDQIGGMADVQLPDDWNQSTSWERAKSDDVLVNRVGRAEWMVRVGDGDLHRILFAIDDGETIGDCDCRGYEHRDWCAHLAALLLQYVRSEIQPADVSTNVKDEVDALWSSRPHGGDDRRPERYGGVRR